MASSTFAEKVRKKITPITSFQHPSEEQGIIFDHIDGLKIRDYLLAVYKLVGGAQNIVAASRVSGGKVIVFLSTKEIAEKFQNEHGAFKIGEKIVTTRKLRAPSVKVILSNVSPVIPNTVIESTLTQLGLQPITPISILRFNPSDDIFSHVISWRRQFYLPANTDLSKIPPVISVTYDDRTYRIFLTKGDFVCFKCGKKGHKAENCAETSFIDEEVEDSMTHLQSPLQPEITTSLPFTGFPPLPPTEKPIIVPPKLRELNQLVSAKRGPDEIASSTQSEPKSTSESYSSEDSDFDEKKEVKPKGKKCKKHKPNPEAYLKSLILSPGECQIITDTVKHIQKTKFTDCDFSAEELIKLLPSTRNNPNRRQIVAKFTGNLECLLFVLEEIKPQMETGTKRTITALIKAVTKEDHSEPANIQKHS
ncbi:hypothetical protein ACFE04_019855 [Oxalis oulophora]